jgi:parallel beta-helix repeat protein
MLDSYYYNTIYTQTGEYTYLIWANDTSNNKDISVIYTFNILTPTTVYIDDDYMISTPGWNITHFDNIQDGVDAVAVNGTVHVYNGTYNEEVDIEKYGISLIGENKESTIIDAGGSGDVVDIVPDFVNISGFTIQNSGSASTDAGIEIQQDNCYISGNIIIYNVLGIQGDSCNNNTITENIIILNSNYGIYLETSNSNFIFNNYFNNTDNAYDNGNNLWNISKISGINIIGGSYLGGNYWNDYSGVDFDGDRLGDTPYDISGGSNQDFYPLMTPQPWSVKIDFTAVENVTDFVVFGEKPDADDGQDTYDVPKPPIPGSPYVYAWFDTNLSPPYNTLWEDYKFYPDSNKIWALSLLCDVSEPQGYTNVTIQWNASRVNASEYRNGSVVLYNCENQDAINMILSSNYTLNATLNTMYQFQIICNEYKGPMASFTYAPEKPTIHDIVQFNDSSTAFGSNIVNWTWDLGDGNISYDRNATHQYSDGGTYNVVLTVRDNNGAEDSYETEITIYSHYVIPLDEKWNMISAPFNESIYKADIVVRNNSIDYTWADAVSEGIILGFLYTWDTTGQFYITTDYLEPGCGSMAYAYYDCELLVYGNVSNDEYISMLDIKWNMMGLPHIDSIQIDDIIVQYNQTDYSWENATSSNNEEGQPIVLGFIYGWNTSTQNYMLSDALIPGYGYWMYAYFECTLIRPTI